jgi:hypothetical protein
VIVKRWLEWVACGVAIAGLTMAHAQSPAKLGLERPVHTRVAIGGSTVVYPLPYGSHYDALTTDSIAVP